MAALEARPSGLTESVAGFSRDSFGARRVVVLTRNFCTRTRRDGRQPRTNGRQLEADNTTYESNLRSSKYSQSPLNAGSPLFRFTHRAFDLNRTAVPLRRPSRKPRTFKENLDGRVKPGHDEKGLEAIQVGIRSHLEGFEFDFCRISVPLPRASRAAATLPPEAGVGLRLSQAEDPL